jgi:hypothetical protein
MRLQAAGDRLLDRYPRTLQCEGFSPSISASASCLRAKGTNTRPDHSILGHGLREVDSAELCIVTGSDTKGLREPLPVAASGEGENRPGR